MVAIEQMWPITRSKYFQFLISCLNLLGLRFGAYSLYVLDGGKRARGSPLNLSGPSCEVGNVCKKITEGPVCLESQTEEGTHYVIPYRQEDSVRGSLEASFGPTYVPELGRSLDLDGMYLQRLTVNVEFRKRGIAKSLIAYSISIPARAGYGDNIYCLVEVDNIPSKKAFEANGFEKLFTLLFIKILKWEHLRLISGSRQHFESIMGDARK